MKALLLPVKAFGGAKSRQAGLLTRDERVAVARAMLTDVSRAIEQSRAPHVFLVSSDPWALRHGRACGWEVLVEDNQASESDSIDWASIQLARGGFSHALRLPADLPLIQSEDVSSLLDWDVATPGALIVPSRDGTGTNALLRSPPDLFPSRFGPNSFQLHLEEARRKGIEAMVARNERLALDLDEPADLRLFLQRAHGTVTGQVLDELGVANRLG